MRSRTRAGRRSLGSPLALITIGMAVVVAPAPGDELKLSRIALFSSGVGYFQADGVVNGDAAIDLRFRNAQINDILKSLVAMDLDGGRVRAVEYPSRDPVEKTLRSFGVDISDRPTLGVLLDRLRGVPVEIGPPVQMKGLLLGVETKIVGSGDSRPVSVEYVNVMTDDGLRTLKLTDAGTIRILDARSESELRQALLTLAAARDSDRKVVRVSFSGDGKRRVRLGYLLESPIWKTSYRLVLTDDQKPYLQGWATIENTTEEDWRDVRVSLVSGRPISYVMDLYTPLYAQRPTEVFERYAMLRSPDHAAGAGDARERMAVPLAAPAPGGQRSSRDRALAVDPESPELADQVGQTIRQSVRAIAEGASVGELFRYEIGSPVSLKRQQSAMLPIVTADVEARKVSIFNRSVHARHPLNGLWLTNSTGLHLSQGPVTVFDGGTYAGDAKLADIRPGEKRLMSYALDLAVEVDLVEQSEPDNVLSIRISRGTMRIRRKQVRIAEFSLRNKDARPRTLVLEHPRLATWEFVGDVRPFESTETLDRFNVDVAAAASRAIRIVRQIVVEDTLVLASSGEVDLAAVVKTGPASAALRAAADEFARRRAEIDRLRERIRESERRAIVIESDQQRIRENLKAISATSDIARRYVSKLDSQESELETVRAEIMALQAKVDDAQADLEQWLSSLEIE